MLDSLTGSYRGIVTAVNDPTGSKRIKVQVPQVAGTAEIQWAEPSDYRNPLPNPGDLVWVYFNGGDPTKPVYSITVDPYKWVIPTLNTGWAFGPAGGSTQPMRIKIDGGAVRIYGAVHTTTTTPSTTVFTLPTGYRPLIEARTGITYNNAGAISHMLAQILPNGNVLTSPTPSAANSDVYFNVWFPLGNLG